MTTREATSVGRPDGRPTGRVGLATRHQDYLVGYLFVLPQAIGAIVLVIVPLIGVVWFSLNDWNLLSGRFTFTGLGNYEKLITDPSFYSSLAASGIFSLGLVVFNLTLALTLAVLLNQRLPGTTTFRAFFFSPVVVSLVAWSVVWGFLLQADGGINGVLGIIGIEGPNWLREGPTAMLAVIVVQTLKGVGINMILFLAALQGVPQELKEAARLDGASSWRVFRSITFPMMSATILMVSIITVIASLEVFALINVMTGGGPGNSTTVLAFYLYQQAFKFSSFGYGSALGVVMFVIILILTLIQWKARKRWVFDEV